MIRRAAFGAGGLPLVTAAITLVTALERIGVIPLRELASSPAVVEDGRVWLLATSAFVADRPVLPSIAGFLVVGLAVWALCGSRVLWTAAAGGHVLGTVSVYAALDAVSAAVGRPDFGTSAIIAAWIGVIAYRLHARGWGWAAVGLCAASALVGWLLRPDLDVLDWEYAAALAVGAATAAWLPRLRVAQMPTPLARWAVLLHGGLLRH